MTRAALRRSLRMEWCSGAGPLRPHTDARTKFTGKDFRRAPIVRRFRPWPCG
jgi:hypothetical protein